MKHHAYGLLIVLASSTGAWSPSSAPAQVPSPPMAEKRPHVVQVHGDRRQDDYFWLRERANPEVAAYLEAENEYARTALAHTESLQSALYDEMLARIQQTDLNVPYRDNGWYYTSRTQEGKQYPIYVRSRTPPDPVEPPPALGMPPLDPGVTPQGPGEPPPHSGKPMPPDRGEPAPEEAADETVILDLNELAEGLSFMALKSFEVSDDGNLLAYSTDSTGFRVYTLRVKDLRTGELLPDRIDGVNTAAWSADNRTLFYTTEDHAKRPYRLYRRVLGAAEDELIYEEKDELFRIEVRRTRSDAYLLLSIASLTTSEVRYLRSDRPTEPWRVVSPRRQGREYEVAHRGERFWIRANDTGRNFRLVSAPVTDPSDTGWREEIPHRAGVMLEGMDFFADHAVLREREAGLPHLRIEDLTTGDSHRVAFPEAAYDVYPSTNQEWETRLFRYGYESLVTPASIFDYDVERRASRLLKQTKVLGGYDPSRYVTERLHARAADGTRIPISLVRRKDVEPDGSAPLLLWGYGAYGYAYPVEFSSNHLSLLDRGMALAIAHVRGGGELGKPWHDAGRMGNKMNTFTDFIAVAEFLIEQGHVARDRLVIEGGSAGGLLMGAVTNLRPDLFKAVVSHVPFVDVINTMMDASLPLTVIEYEEWGNPHREEEYRRIAAYCPYTNVAARAYPALLVKTSFQDSQVMYWEPAKYVARLRASKTDANPLLLVTNMGAGHGGASGRYDALRERALDYAFILWQAGLAPGPP